MTTDTDHLRVEESRTCYRVAFVNTHPIQYFAPLYRYLQQNAGFDVTALYFSDSSLRGAMDAGFGREIKWDINLLDGYKAEFMGEAAKRRERSGFFSMIAPEVWSAIRYGRFDAIVIHGHYVAGHHLALAAARSCGTPVFARGDTNGFRRRSGWRALVRQPVLSRLYKFFDGVLSVGTANDVHYHAMGVSEEKIFRVPFTVDNDRFSSAVRDVHSSARELRSHFGLDPELPTICFAAKLTPHKRPSDVLTAYKNLVARGIPAQLAIAGTGVLESSLRAEAAKVDGGTIKFLGFLNQSQLPRFFAACDVFVLPSELEPWGLVVNEAMCAGLPIVSSRECGCSHDLVHDGRNGRIYAAGDVEALTSALAEVLTDESLRRRYGVESRAIISRWSFRECAEGLRHAIATVRFRKGL